MATRIVLTDESGRWFDADQATVWEESTTWDGKNHVSRITRSPWRHSRLYRSRYGRFYERRWSDWQGEGETVQELTARQAAAWFLENGTEAPEELRDEVAALEDGALDAGVELELAELVAAIRRDPEAPAAVAEAVELLTGSIRQWGLRRVVAVLQAARVSVQSGEVTR